MEGAGLFRRLSSFRILSRRNPLEAELRGELEAARAKFGDNGAGRPEVWIRDHGPKLVGRVQWIRRRIGRIRIDLILYVVDHVLLEIWMVEKVKGFGSEAYAKDYIQRF